MGGEPVRLTDVVTALRRGYQFEFGGQRFMSFVGAPLDFAYRVPGQTWFETEIPKGDDVAFAIAGGLVEVLITHETVDGGTHVSQAAIDTNLLNWSMEALEYSALSLADELRRSGQGWSIFRSRMGQAREPRPKLCLPEPA